MRYVVKGLDPSVYAHLRQAPDEVLRTVGARRVVADACPGYPCRVSLEDALVGETLVLLPFAHHQTAGPYRASGPVYAREEALKPARIVNELPEQLRIRLLSIRAYDANGDMVDAEVVEGVTADRVVRQQLERADVAFLHVHFARRGCYAARIDRVT